MPFWWFWTGSPSCRRGGLSPASSELAEPGVHLVEVDRRGVEVRGGTKAQPVEQVLVLLVPWIRQGLLQARISPRSAAVLGRARTLAGQARQACSGIGREDLFQHDVVFPVIAEVIGVAHPGAGSGQNLSQRHLALVGVPERAG